MSGRIWAQIRKGSESTDPLESARLYQERQIEQPRRRQKWGREWLIARNRRGRRTAFSCCHHVRLASVKSLRGAEIYIPCCWREDWERCKSTECIWSESDMSWLYRALHTGGTYLADVDVVILLMRMREFCCERNWFFIWVNQIQEPPSRWCSAFGAEVKFSEYETWLWVTFHVGWCLFGSADGSSTLRWFSI